MHGELDFKAMIEIPRSLIRGGTHSLSERIKRKERKKFLSKCACVRRMVYENVFGPASRRHAPSRARAEKGKAK